MFERGEIKTAVKKAEKFRKTEQKQHDFASKLRDNAQARAKGLEEDIIGMQQSLQEANDEAVTEGECARTKAKTIIAVDNLIKNFLYELDLLETGKKKPQTG